MAPARACTPPRSIGAALLRKMASGADAAVATTVASSACAGVSLREARSVPSCSELFESSLGRQPVSESSS
jgi:hypothetical protein